MHFITKGVRFPVPRFAYFRLYALSVSIN